MDGSYHLPSVPGLAILYFPDDGTNAEYVCKRFNSVGLRKQIAKLGAEKFIIYDPPHTLSDKGQKNLEFSSTSKQAGRKWFVEGFAADFFENLDDIFISIVPVLFLLETFVAEKEINFLIGHGTGGFVAAHLAQRLEMRDTNPLCGVILMSSFGRVQLDTPTLVYHARNDEKIPFEFHPPGNLFEKEKGRHGITARPGDWTSFAHFARMSQMRMTWTTPPPETQRCVLQRLTTVDRSQPQQEDDET